VLKAGYHDSPSREGDLIPLLAGLLTLASSNWPPSQLSSVALWPVLHDHSGAAVPDSHRLPYWACSSTRSKVLPLITPAALECQERTIANNIFGSLKG